MKLLAAPILALALVGAGCAPKAAAPASAAPPPATRTVDVADDFYGTNVADPYRWLERADDPEVKAWSDAQNARTRAYLDKLPNRPAIAGKLKQLIAATGFLRSISIPPSNSRSW
jgi:prolyl oligopeptidase